MQDDLVRLVKGLVGVVCMARYGKVRVEHAAAEGPEEPIMVTKWHGTKGASG